MIRKTVIWVCLLLALATVVINVTSRYTEFILWGKDKWQGGSPNGSHYFYQDEVGSIGSRGSFVDGSFLHVSTYFTFQGLVNQKVNGMVFRWSQTLDVMHFGHRKDDFSFELPKLITVRLYVPLWTPFLLFMVPGMAALLLGPYRRHRRRKKGLCLKCGYNLTGNVSGICPECGEKI